MKRPTVKQVLGGVFNFLIFAWFIGMIAVNTDSGFFRSIFLFFKWTVGISLAFATPFFLISVIQEDIAYRIAWRDWFEDPQSKREDQPLPPNWKDWGTPFLFGILAWLLLKGLLWP
jgi:hypothetical protein